MKTGSSLATPPPENHHASHPKGPSARRPRARFPESASSSSWNTHQGFREKACERKKEAWPGYSRAKAVGIGLGSGSRFGSSHPVSRYRPHQRQQRSRRISFKIKRIGSSFNRGSTGSRICSSTGSSSGIKLSGVLGFFDCCGSSY